VRFSLRWVFASIAFLAATCATLFYASTIFSHMLALAMFAFLLLSAVGAVYAKGGERAFYGGSAIVGWSLFASIYIPAVVPLPLEISRSMLNRLHEKIVHEVKVNPATAMTHYRDSSDGYFKNGSFYVQLPSHKSFVTSGQIIAAFVASVVGGAAGRRFHARSQRHASTAEAPTTLT
jgi:hypothetical protein